jgi:hypothetical protein
MKIYYSSEYIKFITGQNEREETTQDAIVTKSAAFASYEINYFPLGATSDSLTA